MNSPEGIALRGMTNLKHDLTVVSGLVVIEKIDRLMLKVFGLISFSSTKLQNNTLTIKHGNN